MSKKLSEKRLHWWPMGVTRQDENRSDEFFMSLAFLALTYFLGAVFIAIGWKYLSLIVFTLYFVERWISAGVADNLTRARKWLVFVQQTTVAALLIAPLIFMFRQNWSWTPFTC